jgi:hypothetical protein
MIDRCQMSEALKLRKLARWFREFAERAGSPAIWDARLRTAEDLEVQADLLESPPNSVPESRAYRGRA